MPWCMGFYHPLKIAIPLTPVSKPLEPVLRGQPPLTKMAVPHGDKTAKHWMEIPNGWRCWMTWSEDVGFGKYFILSGWSLQLWSLFQQNVDTPALIICTSLAGEYHLPVLPDLRPTSTDWICQAYVKPNYNRIYVICDMENKNMWYLKFGCKLWEPSVKYH